MLFSVRVLIVPSTTCLISNRTGASLGNKLLSQGEIWGRPVQPAGQVKQETAKALWEELSSLAVVDVGMWLVQVAVEGRSSSVSSWPGTAHVLLSTPLGCPCLRGGGREGEGVRILCFRQRKTNLSLFLLPTTLYFPSILADCSHPSCNQRQQTHLCLGRQ